MMPKTKTPAAASTAAPALAPEQPKPPARVSKTDQLIILLSRPDGARLEELMQATGWQAHSVRGALAGTLRKKGHPVTSEKADGVRRYRIASETSEGAAQ